MMGKYLLKFDLNITREIEVKEGKDPKYEIIDLIKEDLRRVSEGEIYECITAYRLKEENNYEK